GGARPNLTVVGDDDQSIYKFRGASISNILEFQAAYANCATHVLVENYRSTQAILDQAYQLIQHNNPERLEVQAKVDKHLRAAGPVPEGPPVEARGFDSPSTEADFVAERIAALVASGERRYGDFAVLVRRHAASDPIARALNLRSIPCRVAAGGGLYDRPEVQASLDALSAIADPTDDRALYFLAASEIYDVPALALAELRRGAERRNRGLWATMLDALALDAVPDSAARAALARLVSDLVELRPFALRHPTGETLYRYLSLSGYLERLTREGAEGSAGADAQVQNLARLFEIARGFGRLAVRDRPIEIARDLATLRQAGDDPKAAEPDADEDAVHVLTVHRAKGLEFPLVFLVGLEANHFPGIARPDPLPFPDALIRQKLPGGNIHRAEERRLFYVGMTRAREALCLSWAVDHGGVRQWKPSPFVLEALDQARVESPLTRASAADHLHRHMAVPEPIVLPLTPMADDETLELSNRQVDDWLTCPLKYKYAHVLQVPLLPHHSVGYGLALHNAIRDYYVHTREGWPVDANRLVQVFEESWTGEGFITREHERQRLEQGRAAIRGWYEREQAHPSKPAIIEGAFRFALGANVVRGRFDRVDVRTEGPVIVDFKSSEVAEADKADTRAKESLQLAVYALAYEETSEDHRRPAAVELHFIESGVVGRAPVLDATIARARESITTAAAGIRARHFTATPGYRECGYCAYNAICPAKARGAFG
ncbi:MAG: ATP-dependent DNA helicase, partial [Candidatus Eisenbacteria bacterium]